MRVPDSAPNAQHFGYSHGARGNSAYPLVRAVGLMALRSHLLASVAFGPYETSESLGTAALWPAVPNDSLTIVDRLFFSAGILIPLARDGQIKTQMLDREEAIRSQHPDGVHQELWGRFLAYNLVRLEMERVADEAGVEPVRISFIAALRLICDEWLWCAIASPGAIPKHLRNLRDSLKTLLLPPRRSERRYPRAVKRKMSNYPRKRR